MKTRLMMKQGQKSVNTQLLRSALKMRTKTLKMKATVKAGLKSQELPTLLTTIWRM